MGGNATPSLARQQHPIRQERGSAWLWEPWGGSAGSRGGHQLPWVLQAGPPRPPGLLPEKAKGTQAVRAASLPTCTSTSGSYHDVRRLTGWQDGDFQCLLRQIKSTDELPNPNL